MTLDPKTLEAVARMFDEEARTLAECAQAAGPTQWSLRQSAQERKADAARVRAMAPKVEALPTRRLTAAECRDSKNICDMCNFDKDCPCGGDLVDHVCDECGTDWAPEAPTRTAPIGGSNGNAGSAGVPSRAAEVSAMGEADGVAGDAPAGAEDAGRGSDAAEVARVHDVTRTAEPFDIFARRCGAGHLIADASPYCYHPDCHTPSRSAEQERADVVAWLGRGASADMRDAIAEIERGDHVDAAKGGA